MAARRQVSIFINGREVANTLKGISAEKRKINAELNNMTLGTEEYQKKAAELQKVNKILAGHYDSIRGTESAWKSLAAGAKNFLGLAGIAFTADAIISYGTELFNLGTKMEVLAAKAKTVFAEALPQVTRAAEENATAMGLTTSQYIDAAAAIGDLLIPMGFQREEAAAISTSLVDLSGALSEWTGGQIKAEEVSKILSKALLGEREELKQLGISISEADVQARLAEKGLKGLTGEMLQQAKAAATLELVTEKSLDAQAAYANNADTLVRKQAEVRAQIQQVSETLATALFPIFQRIVGVAASFAEGIGSLAGAFSDILNPVGAATDAFYSQQESVKNLEENILPLADRYDELTKKATLNKDEEVELEKIIKQIGETLPGTIGQVDEYGRILSINTGAVRENIALQGELAEQYKQSAATVIQQRIDKIKEENADLRDQANRWDDIVKARSRFGVTVKEEERLELLQQINANLQESGKLEQQLRQIRGEESRPDAPDKPAAATSPTKDEIQQQAARAEELSKQREKQAEQERKRQEREAEKAEKALATQLEKLQGITEKYSEDYRLSQLSETDRRLEGIRLRYQKEIDEATALEAQGVKAATAQRIELERLQAEEIAAARAEIRKEHEKKEDEAILEAEEKRLEARKQVEQFTRERLLSENEQTLLALEEHYISLANLASQYGIGLADITSAYEAEKARIQKEFRDKEAKENIEEQKKNLEALAAATSASAEIIGNALQLAGEEFAKNTAAGKALTIIQIGLKSAEGIAKAVAAGAGLPFPANLGAIAAGIAAVTSGILAAKKALAETPEVPQRAAGGWLSAIGQDDGRLYRAKYIGQPVTGMLPSHPVLISSASGGPVLASERGSEYFVSNKSLRNPAVLNYVRAIDNIQRHRQFQEGGFTAPPPPSSGPGPAAAPSSTAGMQELAAILARLEALLSRGIYARLDDDTLIDMRDRLNQLIAASGGVL